MIRLTPGLQPRRAMITCPVAGCKPWLTACLTLRASLPFSGMLSAVNGQDHDCVDCHLKVDGAWKPPKNGASGFAMNRRKGKRGLGDP